MIRRTLPQFALRTPSRNPAFSDAAPTSGRRLGAPQSARALRKRWPVLVSLLAWLWPIASPLTVGPWALPWGSAVAAAEPQWQADDATFRKTVEPFLTRYCQKCHSSKDPQGEFRVDRDLPNQFLDTLAKEKWGEVVNVLNSHEMPPEGEPQPKPDAVGKIVDWITGEMARAELIRRDSVVVLRRLNRDEYRNTIRDLIGIDFDVSGFPLDPPAGGFDNNGQALSLSPLHLELYLEAARKIIDRAIVTGDRPESLRWRFEIENGKPDDSYRERFGNYNPILNGGNNPSEDGFKVVRVGGWDRGLNVRDFYLPVAGDYVVRARVAGRVPTREDVVASVKRILQDRFSQQMKENPAGERWHREAMENDLKHFETNRDYDYGRPRMKLVQDLAGQPRTIAEFDINAPREAPEIIEIRSRYTTEQVGITLQYAYDIPRHLENFWMQGSEYFARPTAYVDYLEIEGPLHESWPPPSHVRLLGDEPVKGKSPRESAEAVLIRFLPKAYRRPITRSELTARLALFDEAISDGLPFIEAIKRPLVASLVSPHFLYLGEAPKPPKANQGAADTSPKATESATSAEAGDATTPTTAAARPLNDYELATRLSYFLWSSMPDERLFQLAKARQLQKPATLSQEIDRMLADPKAEAFVKNFAGQWLNLRDVGSNPPALELYPRYDRHLETSIVKESQAFFAEILQHDLDLMNLIKSDFVVINERLARFYDIPDVRGDHFRRVPVPQDVVRGGIVTQASVLTITSNGTRTSPVKRGTWILKNLLGTDPGLPVANAGDIAPKVPGLDKATVRQRLEIHRELPQCARCHNKIDPLGFSLENFNAAGEYRLQEGFGYNGRIDAGDPVIDASSQLPDGTKINGVRDLQKALVKRKELFIKCLAGKLMAYALGREVGAADQPFLKSTVAELDHPQPTLRELIKLIVASPAFQTK